MHKEIPIVVEELYNYFSHESTPDNWPRGFEDNPVQGHGVWSFYQGLQLGMRIAAASLDLR